MRIFDDESETVVDEFKLLISSSLDGKLEDCILDEKTGYFITPRKARLITPGQIEGLSGNENEGELTLAQVTKAEIEVLIEHYLKDIKSRKDYERAYEYTCSGTYRAQVLSNMRIDEFIESGAITQERVNELSDRIYSENHVNQMKESGDNE